MEDVARDDDLLRPSLDESHDAVGFDAPWNPYTLVFVAFFGGLITGGALLAMNFKKLGHPSRFWPTILVTAALGVALVGAGVWTVTSGTVANDADAKRMIRLANRCVSVVVSLAIAATQARRFRLADVSGIERGKLLVPAILAVIVGIAVNVAAAVFFVVVFGGAVAR